MRGRRQDPNKIERRAAGAAKLVLIKTRVEKARKRLRDLQNSSDKSELLLVDGLLVSIIDLCEDEES